MLTYKFYYNFQYLFIIFLKLIEKKCIAQKLHKGTRFFTKKTKCTVFHKIAQTITEKV